MQESNSKDTYGNVLAFDYGSKKLGIAMGSAAIGRATGIATLNVTNGKLNQQQLQQIIQQWEPQHFIVGLAIPADQKHNNFSAEILKFGNWLEHTFKRSVTFVDERLSTEEAKHRLLSQKGYKMSHKTDLHHQVAAEIILETYFHSKVSTSNSS